VNERFRRECLRLAMDAQTQDQIDAAFHAMASTPDLLAWVAELPLTSE